MQPPEYSETLREGISGMVTTQIIGKAGHMAELDQPDAVAAAVSQFLEG